MEKEIRVKQITRTSIIGIITNIFLSVFKATVGLISGSIAIVLDAVNNLTDALSSVITIVGIKLARRSPDKTHPFGYGRIEYMSAIVITGIVFAAGATSLVESIKKIIHPQLPEYSTAAIIVVVVAIVVKLLLGKYVSNQGKKYNSDALKASGADASFDAIISFTTLVGAVITIIWNISIDGYIGAVISLFIMKAGLEMLFSPLRQLLGTRNDSVLTREIKRDIASFEGVNGAYDLILNNYGPEMAIGSVHIEVSDTLSSKEVFLLTKRIQRQMRNKYHIFFTIGIYAVNTQEGELKNMQETIKPLVYNHQGVIGVHAVFIDVENKLISFDMVVDFEVRDITALHSEVMKQVQELYPEYAVEINIDTNYSD